MRTRARRVHTHVNARILPTQPTISRMDSRRRLPHIYPENRWLFVTWHLFGSLPHSRYPPSGITSGEAFVWIDRFLDKGVGGPLYLKQIAIAQIVCDSLCVV